jgi:hypothetical protein
VPMGASVFNLGQLGLLLVVVVVVALVVIALLPIIARVGRRLRNSASDSLNEASREWNKDRED